MRAYVAAALAAVILGTAGCRVSSAGEPADGDSASPVVTASAAVAYRPPTDPCAAASTELAARFALQRPIRQSTTLYAMDSAAADPLVAYEEVGCEWVVTNPASGPGGRPNQLTARVAYAVVEPTRDRAAVIAQGIYLRERQKLRDDRNVSVVREAPAAVTGDDGYYVYATEKSTTGASGLATSVLRRANAVVVVRFSGADLSQDPSLPPGLQLVTTPLPEARLQPVVDSLLPEAVRNLAR